MSLFSAILFWLIIYSCMTVITYVIFITYDGKNAGDRQMGETLIFSVFWPVMLPILLLLGIPMLIILSSKRLERKYLLWISRLKEKYNSDI